MEPTLLGPLAWIALTAVPAQGDVNEPAPPSPAVVQSEVDLDFLRFALDEIAEARRVGDVETARWHLEEVTKVLTEDEGIASEEEQQLLFVLGSTAKSLSLPSSQLTIAGRILRTLESTLPVDHPSLLSMRIEVAIAMGGTGDLEGARSLREAVLETRERILPEDHPALLTSRNDLAVVLHELGDLRGSLELHEAVLEARERSLPEDHPLLLMSRGNLALVMSDMGDLRGARELQESVLEAWERILPEDHATLLTARSNLAGTMLEMGDLAEARRLLGGVLEARERILPEDHPDVLASRGDLAAVMGAMGESSRARALLEAVLEARERSLPAGHSRLQSSRQSLAQAMSDTGDLAGARAHLLAVLEAYERIFPSDFPPLLWVRVDLAVTTFLAGDLSEARALLRPSIDGTRARVLATLALSPRQARETVASAGYSLERVLFLSEGADPELRAAVFGLVETMRAVSGEAGRALRGGEGFDEIEAVMARAAEVRSELNDLALSSSGEGRSSEELASELNRLVGERDRLERRAAGLLAERGVAVRPVEAGALAARLPSDAAAVGYRRIARLATEGTRVVAGEDHLLAHVLLPSGALARVDLGPAAELEELVARWRAALGAPLQRGLAPEGDGADAEREAGKALRARLLDPVLAEVGERARRLHVCADDLVFLVPLDALPLDGDALPLDGADGEERVGDRWSIASEVSFARLVNPQAPARNGAGESGTEREAPDLLALGGVDYDAGAVEGEALAAAGASRGSLPARFSGLFQTRYEARTTADLFEELTGGEASVLGGKEATKEALFARAPGKRYVHLATHGWFAPETIRSQLDDGPGGRPRTGIEERVRGLAPMLLCGLALAGANGARDALGRGPGLLSAEELCSLDLGSCELAVLSACETNVGVRRAGQGIQSLQAALHAAGARSSVTSLWKVDDAATRRLMELFYTALWKERQPLSEALWQAKRALRAEGAPVRDWGGWVLTGIPE